MSEVQQLKKDLFKQHSIQKTATETGSAESQVALFTHRIKHITAHLKTHRKDYSSQLGLIRLVGKRKKQLRYLKKEDINRYRAICNNLSIRK